MLDKNIVDVHQEEDLGTSEKFAEEGVENTNQTTVAHTEEKQVSQIATQKQKLSKFESQKRTKRVCMTIVSAIAWVVGIGILYLCLSNVYQNMFNPSGCTGFFGVGQAVVVSNSMEPELKPDDLIFYRSVAEQDVQIGDTIIYQKQDEQGEDVLVVHDVIAIKDGYVVAKGLNNAVSDEPFPVSCIVGKYMFKVSKVGVLLNALSTPWAPVVILLFLCAVLAIQILTYYIHRKKVINSISTNDNTRAALKHFFDI